jgi:hypothetical protein
MASLSKNKEFYAEVYKTARELGYNPVQSELAASQAYHESMSRLGIAGGSGLAKNHNNLFGMKAGSSWNGPVANMKTQEEVKGRNVTIRDAFRAYPTKRDSIVDYFDRLKSRWPEAYKAKTLDEAIAGLGFGKKGGYATDTQYGSKIARTALSNTPAREVAERRVANIFGANPVPASAPKPGIDGERIAYNPTRDQFGDKATIPQSGAAARLASQLAQYRPSQGGLIPQGRVPVPTPALRANMSAAPTRDFRAPPAPLTITPNKVNTFTFSPPRQAPTLNPAVIQRMQDNLTSKMAFAQPNPSNMNISGYGFATPAKPSGPQASGSATGSINRASAVGNMAVPGRSPGVLGGRGNINPPNVVSPPANNLPAFDENGRWTGGATSPAALANQYSQYQRGAGRAPVEAFGLATGGFGKSAVSGLMGSVRVPDNGSWKGTYGANTDAVNFAPGPTTSPSVQTAQAQTARQMAKDQFARDLVRSMPAPTVNVDRGRFGPGPSKAELANQYSQYQRGTVPSAQINPSVYDMVDVPQSSTIASQYASYGAGKIAPQRAATTTQAVPAAPSIPNVPQTVGPRAPSAPAVNAPMTQQQRMDKALADMRVGIPPKDIYKEQLGVPVAPANPVFGNGFRGFGAGGFLGNLLTGNLRNAASIPGGFQLPGVLGIIQNAVQRLGGPQQAAQAVQTVAPALGQVMGLPAAQQAAKAGNNMVIGRDANGILGWVADGGLSAGAANAGWMSNNPERNFGGYGGGYDPTPV